MAAAAVILSPAADLVARLSGVRDSKQMTARQRAVWAEKIQAVALAWGVGFATAQEIDERGILPATRLAMQRALAGLDLAPEHLLLDAVRARVQQSQLNEVFIINPAGQVVFSTEPALLDQSFANEPLLAAGLTGPYINPPAYAADQGTPEVTVAQPIVAGDGNIIGVIAAKATLSELASIMQDATGLGEAGDAYLVDKLQAVLLPSRYNQPGIIAYNATTVAALADFLRSVEAPTNGG